MKFGEESPAARKIVGKFASWFEHWDWDEAGGEKFLDFKDSYSSPPTRTSINEPPLEYDWNHPDLEYRFHINSLPDFKNILERAGARPEDVTYTTEPTYESAKVEIKIKDFFKPFPDQVDIVEQLKNPEIVSKLVGMQTGGGKSAMSIFAAAHWGYRTVGFMKPGYLDKWRDDVMKQCDIAPTQILLIGGENNKGGSEKLIWLINGLMDGWLEPTFVFISNATMRNWISDQEKLPPGEYVPGFRIFPWEFMQACGFGFRIIDETHQDFHANFLFDLYTHIEQSVSLSATLVNRNQFLMDMYQMAYPDKNRMRVPEYRKYARTVAWMFDIHEPRRLKTTARGRTSYSHVEFEKSLHRSSKLYKQYYLMIYDVMRKTYFFERKDGEKCLIYFATRKMCEDAMMYYKQLMPELKLAKYNQGDSLIDALGADVIFATLQKAGTAIDIPNLTTVIMTVAIDSIQSNLQALGRLRDLKKLYGSDRVPTFVYFVCMNIAKHMSYHKSKKDLLKDRALISTTMHHTATLGL
ncbi:hypothetical protein [Burkholderia phage FLC8]|nr:hypothetical protein [Burkholderia phage FLC8]